MKANYSQSEYVKVNTIVIEPLKRHYGADFDLAKLDEYVLALKRFSEASLREGMQEVLMSCKRNPTIAHIAEGCRKNQPINGLTKDGEKYIKDIREKYDIAFKKAIDYTNDFMNNRLGSQAYAEGWGTDLRNYVFAQVNLQSHHVENLNVGYDAEALFNYNSMKIKGFTTEEIEKRKKRELEYAHRQNSLNAEPAADLIAEWKHDAKRRSQRKKGSSSEDSHLAPVGIRASFTPQEKIKNTIDFMRETGVSEDGIEEFQRSIGVG